MSTENNVPDTNLENTNPDNTEQKAPEYSKIELEAMEMGWRPKEEFNGDEDDFIDAKEFVRRKPLFDKIDSTTRELKQFKKAFDALKGHYTAVHESAYQQALANLKATRKQAISDGDGDTFDRVDQEIKRVEAAAENLKEVTAEQEVAPEPQLDSRFVAWTNRNPWYNSVGYMRSFADDLGQKLHASGMQPLEVLKQVEEAVKKEFPQKFRNQNKDDAPDVQVSGRRASGGKKDDFTLDPQEERIFQTLHKSDPKTFTREKYIADLKAVKGIK